jgi:3-isopropylmalate dehydrogenase
MVKNITLIPGDGIGPDIVEQAVNVLNRIGEKFEHTFNYETVLAGGAALDACGEPLPQKTLDTCLASDGILLGAVGGPKWDVLPGSKRPEQALLGLRKGLGVYANLRPVNVFRQLADASPLKQEIIGEGFDFLFVRELTGGIYFGQRGRDADGNGAFDTEYYSRPEIERVLRVGFEAAMKRSKKVCVVDKANILESSRLWREVSEDFSKGYPEVALSYMYVDNCAMQLVRNPAQFDVIVTSNMFGDILSDEASMISGSIGMLSSASLGDGTHGLYEPIHGSAPDIAGKDLANPLATILSAAMMLRYSFGMTGEADTIEAAVNKVLDAGYRTGDIKSAGCKLVGTREMGRLVVEAI